MATQTMTHTSTDTQIDMDTLACQQLGIKQCDLNRIKLKQIEKHGYDFSVFPNVVMHDAQTFDPIKVVSEYLRCDADELNAIKQNMNWPVIDGKNMRRNIGNKK